MQWTDEGIVIGVRRHGEASAILELMTRAHGRHLGLVRGGFGSRMKPVLQAGQRRERHLAGAARRASRQLHRRGHEPARVEFLQRAARDLWRQPSGRADAAVCRSAIRMTSFMTEFEQILDRLDDAGVAAPMVARFELQLLSELGFGLDLQQCAATGDTRRSHLCVAEIGARGVAHRRRALGRQDAAAAGLPARGRRRAAPAAISPTALRSPAFSCMRHVLEPRGLALADERAHFIAALEPRAAERGITHRNNRVPRVSSLVHGDLRR